MHPQVQQPEAGPCPLCGMDLILLQDSEGDGTERVTLSPRAAILAGIETAEVKRLATPGVDLRLLGRVEVDEGRIRNVSAWIGGRIDKLHVRETGTLVRRGQSIASLYSPEIYTAHQDLLTAVRQVAVFRDAGDLARGSADSALEAARERLSLLGFPKKEIDSMAKDGKPRKSVSIRATYSGTVMERMVTQGQYVDTGDLLYKIADLSVLWVQLDAYEADLATIVEGQSVELEVEALPAEVFTGTVAFIDPVVDARRRVARVRVEVDNAEGKLRPGMFVEAVVRGRAPSLAGVDEEDVRQKPLVVPATAPLFTGKRSLVYVERVVHVGPGGEPSADTRPSYEPRVVELGPRMGEVYPVIAGLSPGERVVVHGAFAIDADLQIRGGASMMSQPDASELEALGTRVEPSEVLRASLADVVEAYLAMQVSLADDDWRGARAAGTQLMRAAADTSAGGAWEILGPELERRGEEAAESSAIEGARGAFLHASAATKRLLQVYGNPLDQPLHLAYCPMAATDQGAEWIQAGEVVDNSYFGESMLSCGEIRSQVDPGQYVLVEGGSTP